MGGFSSILSRILQQGGFPNTLLDTLGLVDYARSMTHELDGVGIKNPEPLLLPFRSLRTG